MKIIHDIAEKQMIGSFLRGELDSVRFSPVLREEMAKLEISDEVIKNPDYSKENENNLRKSLFAQYRGYGENKLLFEAFPSNVRWTRVELTSDELLQVKYINYSYWNEISKNTRSPIAAVKTVEAGEEIFGVNNDNFLKAAQFLMDGGKFPELILVSQNERSYLVALEGHLRLTAYALAPQYIPQPLTAIVGFSEEITQWPDY